MRGRGSGANHKNMFISLTHTRHTHTQVSGVLKPLEIVFVRQNVVFPRPPKESGNWSMIYVLAKGSQKGQFMKLMTPRARWPRRCKRSCRKEVISVAEARWQFAPHPASSVQKSFFFGVGWETKRTTVAGPPILAWLPTSHLRIKWLFGSIPSPLFLFVHYAGLNALILQDSFEDGFVPP